MLHIIIKSANVTGPARMDQVGTIHTLSQNVEYVGCCVHDLLYFSCKRLHIKLFIDDRNFIVIA